MKYITVYITGSSGEPITESTQLCLDLLFHTFGTVYRSQETVLSYWRACTAEVIRVVAKQFDRKWWGNYKEVLQQCHSLRVRIVATDVEVIEE